MARIPKVWIAACMNPNKPIDIPNRPDIVYEKDWQGWADFLAIDEKDIEYMEIEDIVSDRM